jgi:hypothetical protein
MCHIRCTSDPIAATMPKRVHKVSRGLTFRTSRLTCDKRQLQRITAAIPGGVMKNTNNAGFRAKAALVVGLLVATGPALAADLAPTLPSAPPPFEPTAPAWSVVGSFSPSFTRNALFSRDDRRSDVFLEPDVSLRLDGKLTPDLSYRFYARSSFESFATETLANEAVARFGARLNQNVAGWNLTAVYENRYDFDGVYRDLAFTSNDVSGSISRDFVIGNTILAPMLLLTYRFSDLAEARRYRLDALVGIEVKLNEKWAVVSTPMVEAFWFTDGLNTGRRDQIYSASLGLKYNIKDNIALTMSGLYEARNSNVPLRHYRDFVIGPKLDFAF